MKRLALIAVLVWPLAALAQGDPADRARAALAMWEDAAEALADAQSARDRVRALTATVVAYEEGLSALRTGLRQASLREAELLARLQEHDGEIAALLGALQRVGGTSSPVMLLHPAGPLGTARAGMLLADVAPALNGEADDLRQDLQELRALQAVSRLVMLGFPLLRSRCGREELLTLFRHEVLDSNAITLPLNQSQVRHSRDRP